MSNSRSNANEQAIQKELEIRQAGPSTAALAGHSIFKKPSGVEPLKQSNSLRRTRRAHNLDEMEELIDEMESVKLSRGTRVYDGEELRVAMGMNK